MSMEKVAIIQPCGNTPKSPTKIHSGPLCGDEPFAGGTLFEAVLRCFEHKKSLPNFKGGIFFQTRPTTTYLVTLNVAVLLVVPVRAVITLVLVAV